MIVIFDDLLLAFLNELSNLRTLYRHAAESVQIAFVLRLAQTLYGHRGRRKNGLCVRIENIEVHLHLL